MRIIPFGAGSGFADFLSVLPDHVEIVGLCDNDPNKHGRTVMGHRVLAPEALDTTPFDFVVVTTRGGDTIRTQLVNRGVPREKVLLFYSIFDGELRNAVNRDMESLNRHLGLGLHPVSLCTMQIWPDNHSDLPSGQDDFCRMMSFRLAADRILEQAVPGSIAELGVYRGELASVLNRLFPERRLYLFDTFEGFSENDLATGEEKGHSQAAVGDFQDTNIGLVLSRMAHPENVSVHKGYFPETTTGLEDQFALVSLDVDLYKPTLAGLNYFYPRLSRGGFIFVHDYNNRRFRGVRSAVDEFTKSAGAAIVQLPDLAGTAIVAK
jgi:O-methyltransferase